jgi:hypothetical protein
MAEQVNAFGVEYITNTTCTSAKHTRARHCVPASEAEKIVKAVNEYSKKYRVDQTLIYQVMQVESTFNPKAVSPHNAKGLLQVIEYWHRDKIAGRNIYDIDTNIDVGTQILREYMDRFKSTTAALQAYVGDHATKTYSNAVYAVKEKHYDGVHPDAEDRLNLPSYNVALLQPKLNQIAYSAPVQTVKKMDDSLINVAISYDDAHFIAPYYGRVDAAYLKTKRVHPLAQPLPLYAYERNQNLKYTKKKKVIPFIQTQSAKNQYMSACEINNNLNPCTYKNGTMIFASH